MEQQSFDKVIKNSLEHLNVPFDAEHWQQMELLLHNLPVGDVDAIDAHFDQAIKDKISRQQPDLAMTAWKNIEASLTNLENADADFDAVVNDKVAALEVGVAANWAAIESELGLAETADQAFDTEIYTNLKNLNSSYQPSHWERLVAKLNANYAVREKLYRYKLMEATLMILLLLQFYQYLPNDTFVVQKQRTESKEIFEQPNQRTAPPAIELKTDKAKNARPVVANKGNKAVYKKTEKVAFKATNKSEYTAEATEAANLSSNNNYSIATILKKEIPSGIDVKSGLSISVSEMNQHLTLHTETGNSIIKTVPSLRPDFIESLYITPLGCKDCKHSKIPARLRLGVLATLGFNNTYVSGGDILDINAFTDRGFGYGSGISLGFKYSRWEIETGLNYVAKRYDPNIVDTPVPNQIRTHFQSVHLQNIQFPLNLRYNYAILGKGKWHLYAQTGAAVNLILRTEYDLAQISSISRSKVNDVTTSRLSQISYNKGIFAGDGFKSNNFLTINMGAGVERYISPSWSIFLQPDFHFHFSGSRIGPTEDRINTFNITFGARKSLF
ncbi:MAG: hypothetical protein AAGJ18_22370, partial [Bacteroidota bacterium]